MRLTKQALEQKYRDSFISQQEQVIRQGQHLRYGESGQDSYLATAEPMRADSYGNSAPPKLSLDLGLGKILTVFFMAMFMLIGPAILYENREQLVSAVINTTQANSPTTTISRTTAVTADNPQVTQQPGRVAGLSDQAGTTSGQSLSIVFFVIGVLLLTVPVFVVLKL